MNIFKKLCLWRKTFSAHLKLKKSRERVRAYYESTKNENSKSFEEVMQDLKDLINGGKAFPVRETVEHYFQYGLQYKGACIGDFIFNSEWFTYNLPILEWAKEDAAILTAKERCIKHFEACGITTTHMYGFLDKTEGELQISDKGRKTALIPILLDKKRLFIKPHDGHQGKGAYLLEAIDEHDCLVNGQKCTFSELAEKVNNEYIVETAILNHPDLAKIYPHSLNTMRIVTMRDTKGEVQYISGFHRFGVGGTKVDNAHSGGVAVGINADKGCWKKTVYSEDPAYRNTMHPDSGFVYENQPIPFFKEAIELAIKAHKSFERIQAVGWDIAITPEGPLIIEGNQNFWFNGNQYIDKPFRKEFEAYMISCAEALKQGKQPW